MGQGIRIAQERLGSETKGYVVNSTRWVKAKDFRDWSKEEGTYGKIDCSGT